MNTYIVEYNNTGFDNYLRHYKTDSYYDALRWFMGMKYTYRFVRMREGSDVLEEYVQYEEV